jgi:heme-degrading monooxygenase HmoA
MMPGEDTRTPKYVRIWRGRTTRDKADAYLRYWREEGGFFPLANNALAVQMLREDHGDVTEFITVTWWPSIEAMLAFTNSDDPTKVQSLPRDAEFLLEVPERVQILEVVNGSWALPPLGESDAGDDPIGPVKV